MQDNYDKISAGSGNSVLSSCPVNPKQESEDRISNPRVLSDMGLAIPRPIASRYFVVDDCESRLGDPRTYQGLYLRYNIFPHHY